MFIASIQLNSQAHLENNLTHIAQAVAYATEQGADLVVLPENACLMGRQADIATHFDELSTWYANLAQKHAIALIAGTLPCPFDQNGQALDNGKFYQSSLAFDQTGTQIARYDKIHLFRANVADGVGAYDENKTFVAGTTPVCADFVIKGVGVRVGMMICFDLRFARLAQLYRQLGADILVAPSAFTLATGQVYWELLLKARAIDSQCFVVGSAQGGTHTTTNSSRQTYGHSMIVGADGQVLASTDVTYLDNPYQIAMSQFDKDALHDIRKALPIFECHRLA